MPPDSGSPADWIRHARSDLALARQKAEGEVLPETLCFHAQQAAEKAIKAVLIQCGIPVPRTHSIERLVGLLPVSIERTHLLIEAADLTSYAGELRYPSDEGFVSEDDHAESVRIAEMVVRWAEGIVGIT